jgi:hypothetical protein
MRQKSESRLNDLSRKVVEKPIIMDYAAMMMMGAPK